MRKECPPVYDECEYTRHIQEGSISLLFVSLSKIQTKVRRLQGLFPFPCCVHWSTSTVSSIFVASAFAAYWLDDNARFIILKVVRQQSHQTMRHGYR